jgi:hypothetical protein
LAVVASGLYHGVSPGMGWPLAVSAGLLEKSPRAVFLALWPLSVGHFLASLLVLLPFAFLITLAQWRHSIQVAAGLLVIGFGTFRLINRRHPRALARIRPTQLGLWSFTVAIAHGAGLLLMPIYLGLCLSTSVGQEVSRPLVEGNLGMAALVAIVHVAAMIAAGGCMAWLVFRHLGLQFVSRSWLNLDISWAASLILVGTISVAFNFMQWH